MKNIFIILSLIAFALEANTLKDVTFSEQGSRAKTTIVFDTAVQSVPSIKIEAKTISISLNGEQGAKLNKSFDLSSNKDLNVSSSMNGNKLVVMNTFSYNVEKYKNLISMSVKDNKIEVSFPKVAAPVAFKPIIEGEGLDEEYLRKLESEAAPVVAKKVEPITQKKEDFSFSSKVLKFVGFLLLVLAFFYGVVLLMKKAVISKGKLGFLNNTNQVSVLSQTHIAPKRSLMLIQAHNQVFLVGSTEAGFHAISEISDVSGLIKNGEKIIAGDNFDDQLNLSNKNDTQTVNLKDDILTSNKESVMSKFENITERVRFSDQIKNKIKNLKPMQ